MLKPNSIKLIPEKLWIQLLVFHLLEPKVRFHGSLSYHTEKTRGLRRYVNIFFKEHWKSHIYFVCEALQGIF